MAVERYFFAAYVTITINLCYSSSWDFLIIWRIFSAWRWFKACHGHSKRKRNECLLIQIGFWFSFIVRFQTHRFKPYKFPKLEAILGRHDFFFAAFHFHMSHIGIAHIASHFSKNLLISNHWKIKANKPNAIVYCVMLESTARASEPQDWINWINCLLRKIFINIKLMLINASSFQILVAFIRQLFKAVFIPYGAYVVVNILVTM